MKKTKKATIEIAKQSKPTDVKSKALSKERQRIDDLDARIVALLSKRADCVREIGHIKQQSSSDVYVPAREKAVLDHIRAVNKGPLNNTALVAIYREIMSASLALERRPRVAFFGPAATFTHQAARKRFGSSVEYIAVETIKDVFEAVLREHADYGVVPIENSTEGAVTHTLDEFADTQLKICAEVYLDISHNLMSAGPRSRIRAIYSHPQVFGQCRRWLQREMPGCDLVPVTSTARAAEMAAREKGNTAAIASRLAAETHSLRILASDIQDLSGNTTRFLVLGPRFGRPTGDDKTSLLFAVRHEAGALYCALSALKDYGLNMTKIESRPSKLKAWEYFFFVDFVGHAEDPSVCRALKKLEKHCALLSVLGSYPKAPEHIEA